MATETDIAKKARAYLDSRVAAVEGITKAVAARRKVEEKLAEADEQIALAYQAALDAGWSQGELKEQLGIAKPVGFKKAGKQDSTAAGKKDTAATPAPAPEQHHGNDNQQ